MTEPAEKATRRPRFSPSWQALAVRQLEAVAIFMPMKPDRPEKKPPVRKAKGTNHVSRPQAAMTHSTTTMQAKNTYHGILALEVCVSTLTNGLGDLLHEGGALREAQHLLCGDDHKEKRNDGANKCG